jgi:hypothetical protein
MAGQAANCSREEVRSAIKAVECNKGGSKSTPKMTMKTTSKQ